LVKKGKGKGPFFVMEKKVHQKKPLRLEKLKESLWLWQTNKKGSFPWEEGGEGRRNSLLQKQNKENIENGNVVQGVFDFPSHTRGFQFGFFGGGCFF